MYNLEQEEVIAECQLVALEAIRKHNKTQSSLKTFVHACVFRFLLGKVRFPTWRRRFCLGDSKSLFDVRGSSGFSLRDLLIELSEPAAEVVKIVVTTQMKKTELIKTLKTVLGWGTSKIGKVFEEIREAL